MEIVFADAFYFIALLNQDDSFHGAAISHSSSLAARLVSSEFVLLEVADAFAGAPQRSDIQHFIHAIRTLKDTEIVPVSSDLLDAGLTLYAQRKDKKWSLTDCTSFVIMRERSIARALTHDHHFQQAGFRTTL